jgi:hypothetical protein
MAYLTACIRDRAPITPTTGSSRVVRASSIPCRSGAMIALPARGLRRLSFGILLLRSSRNDALKSITYLFKIAHHRAIPASAKPFTASSLPRTRPSQSSITARGCRCAAPAACWGSVAPRTSEGDRETLRFTSVGAVPVLAAGVNRHHHPARFSELLGNLPAPARSCRAGQRRL